jgi:hypothetical protein
MPLPSLLAPTRSQLELLWTYVERMGTGNPNVQVRENGVLGKAKLLLLASEIHALLFLSTVRDLKEKEGMKQWKGIQDLLMKERVFLLGKVNEGKGKQKWSKDEKDSLSLLPPPISPLQLSHTRLTSHTLLSILDVNKDGTVSKQEFVAMWAQAAERLLGQRRKEGDGKEEGVIKCVIM